MQNDDVDSTVLFLTIQKMFSFGKSLMSSHQLTEGIHLKDSIREPISLMDDLMLHFLLSFVTCLKLSTLMVTCLYDH